MKVYFDEALKVFRKLWPTGKWDGRGHSHARENARRVRQIRSGVLKP